MNGSVIQNGVRCADVAKAIAEAGRPVTLELERSSENSCDATLLPVSSACESCKKGERREECEQGRLLFRTADIEVVLVDCSDFEDFIRLSVRYSMGSMYV